MCLNRFNEHTKTLSFRLTLMYGGIFLLSSVAAFGLFYTAAGAYLLRQVDEELIEDAVEMSGLLAAKGLKPLIEDITEDAWTDDPEEMFVRLLARDGSLIVSTDLSPWPDTVLTGLSTEAPGRTADPVFRSFPVPEKRYGVRTMAVSIGSGVVFHAGVALQNRYEVLAVFRRVFGTTLAVVVLLAVVCGWVMARQALSGIEEVTQTAWQISRGSSFGHRVSPKTKGSEIERLARVFNGMLDRVEKVIQEMSETNDNIAHDLKSPITRIRGSAEVTLTTDSSLTEYRQTTASTIEECDRLLEMINTMLDISETEAGTGRLTFERIDMVGLVRDIVDMFEPLAQKQDVTLVLETPEACPLYGDVKMLQRLTANLLDNAIKFTPGSGEITVSLSSGADDNVVFSVADTGMGIDEMDLTAIFRRFYRCDRSRTLPGGGLGLSLVKAIAESHSGAVDVKSRVGKGSTFTVMLPCLSAE